TRAARSAHPNRQAGTPIETAGTTPHRTARAHTALLAPSRRGRLTWCGAAASGENHIRTDARGQRSRRARRALRDGGRGERENGAGGARKILKTIPL